jgi:hypothetical protein
LAHGRGPSRRAPFVYKDGKAAGGSAADAPPARIADLRDTAV